MEARGWRRDNLPVQVGEDAWAGFLHSSEGNTYMNEIGEANIDTYMQYKSGGAEPETKLFAACHQLLPCSLRQRQFWATRGFLLQKRSHMGIINNWPFPSPHAMSPLLLPVALLHPCVVSSSMSAALCSHNVLRRKVVLCYRDKVKVSVRWR